MGDKPVFDKEKCEKAIREACDLMNSLDLSLVECFWVVNCIREATKGILGGKYLELAALMGLKEDGSAEEQA